MQQYKYKDYQEYYNSQIKAANRKKHKIWTQPEEVRFLSDYIKQMVPSPQKGICHGVRTGWEVAEFRDVLKIDVIGTELSDVFTFDHIIQWDFHEIKPEWIGQMDFIYSNSFDHSLDPLFCLDQWLKCLQPDGICIIQWNRRVEKFLDETDCFAASLDEFKEMFAKKCIVQDVLTLKGGIFKTKHWFILRKENI